MQSRICKYLRHPREAFVLPASAQIEEMERGDELEIDLCVWLVETSGSRIPTVLDRKVGGGASMNDGDCDLCPCFEPVVIPKMPTVI